MQRVSSFRRLRVGEAAPKKLSWVQRLRAWWERPSLKNISFSVPIEELAVYQREADRAGVSLVEWMRARLRGDVRVAPKVLEEAFRQLDVGDARREFSDEPAELKIPVPAAVAAESRVSLLGKPLHTDHVCAHHVELDRRDGGPPKVCGHSSQVGRPCHWPNNRAADCTVFAPRKR